MKKYNQEDRVDAVSPVVGVMLMLVVVIIIAAVVSAFAGGMGTGAKKAPSASIDVKINTAADDTMGGVATIMTFTELSGDPIPTKDLAIVTYFKNNAGTVYKNKQTAASTAVDLFGYGSTTRVPFINDMRYGYSGNNPVKDFGNYTWSSGDVLSTGNTSGTAALLGINSTTIPYSIDATTGFGPGSVVDVKILHVPSGQYLFDKEVVAQ